MLVGEIMNTGTVHTKPLYGYIRCVCASQGMTSRDSDQRYLAASAWLAPSGKAAAVLAAASDASLQLLAFQARPKPQTFKPKP